MTEELTLVWARALLRLNPGLSFCYCSAAGAGGRSMWARVRQRVEGALKSMPFRHAGAVRPGFIRPGPGIRSRTRIYQAGLVVLRPLFPLFGLEQRPQDPPLFMPPGQGGIHKRNTGPESTRAETQRITEGMKS